MSPRELAARALGVDTGAVLSVEPIKHGLTNESWLVRTANDAVVVRISNRHWASLQIDRMAESIVLDVVARAEIGPQIVASDINRGMLVTRYLGATCTDTEMTKPDLIQQLGAIFNALHSLPLPRDVHEVHLPSVVAGYLETLDTLARKSALTEVDLRERAMMLATEIAESSTPRLCHNDVHHLNVVRYESVRFIDWEYAGVGEPYFDLASVCVYHDYSLQQRSLLLNAYAGSASAAQLERLAKCCWLFEYVRDLWTEVRGAIGKA
jgi:thiamine kinase-like enzyme